MIASAAYTLMYMFFGVLAVRFLLPRHRPLNRLWLGLSLGILLEMWLPALGAFLFSFDAGAHAFAAGVLLVLTLMCYVLRDRRDPARWDAEEDNLLVLTERTWTYLAADMPYGTYSAWLSGENKNSISRLEEFWSINPDKRPRYIYVPKNSKWDMAWLLPKLESMGYNSRTCRAGYAFVSG